MCHEKLYLSKDQAQTEAQADRGDDLVESDDGNETDVTVDFTDSSDEEDQDAERRDI